MKEKIARISILTNIILAALKIAVGFISLSAAILAEGFHSFVDIFSSAIGYWGIKISKKPADEKHPYGHYKFEILAGAIITLILFATGVSIIYESYKEILHPSGMQYGYWGFAVMAFSAIVNEVIARVKIKTGEKEKSIALLSDGFHSRIDAMVSLGVFVGLFFVKLWPYIDPLLAILIGLYIIKESISLGKEAFDSLLDVSAGPEVENKIKEILSSQNIKLDSLRTLRKGFAITANLEIILPNNLSIEEAEKITEDLRKKMISEVENLVYVAIQVKGYEVQTEFYKSTFGKGFSWRKRNNFGKNIDEHSKQLGPSGFCVCPICGYKIPHQAGIPCSSIKCPTCGVSLERK